MCLEVILLANIFNLISFSVLLDNLLGEIWVFYLLTIAASESALDWH